MLELVTLLSDGNWYRTRYLGITAGKYLRPEVAWRSGQGNIVKGQRKYINAKLSVWVRFGRVEKRGNGRFTEWRLAKSEWVILYLKALIDILREQAKTPYGPSDRKSRTLEEHEILRLHRGGSSQRQIADSLGCSHMSVYRVLKAAKANIGNVTAVTLSLRQRMAIADAPPERQLEIAKAVVEKRLTEKQTKRLVKLAIEVNEHD